MKILIIYSFFGLVLISCGRNNQKPLGVNSEVSTSELKNHVINLSSDEFEGRGSGYKGEKLAANYIAKKFESIGLQPIKTLDKNVNDFFQSFEFHTLESRNSWEVLNTQNVIGLLKGKINPEEYIIIGAHHDGQGKQGQAILGRNIESIVKDSLAVNNDTIWNSAVDNAVSVSAILEIGRTILEKNIGLNRSIIFTTFSAEESGLDGSTFFVNNPPVPLNQIKAMINLEKLVGDPDSEFLYVSYETNPVFEQIREKTDSLESIKLKPFYPSLIANSDHYAFAQRKIPSITIGTGSQINVHTPLDHAENLDYVLLKKRTEYVLSYLIQLVNSNTTFYFTGNLSGLLGISGGPATKLEKKERGFNGRVAFKVTTVVNDSRGYQAKILPGDLVIAIDNNPIEFKKFYQGLEDVIGETNKSSVNLKILRGNVEIETTINLK
jgi:peptidase M28-like protein